jgi:hypothetical protein
MSDNDIFGELDDRTEDASGGDFADWWEPEDAGEELIGVVVELHSAPQEWTDPGEIPDTIYTIMSVGRGDLEAGTAATPKQHKQLKRGLEGAGIGDLVKLRFTGYQKVDGQPQPMMTYEVGIIPEEEWGELDGADEIEELLEEYDGVEGDNRRTTPYGQAQPAQQDQSGGSGGVDAGDSEIGQAASALKELVEIQDGSVSVEQAGKILTEIREFDVDVEDAAAMAGLTVEDGEISL